MSNNMNTPPTIRWHLLSTVSALALIGSTYMAQAEGNDADRPTIWIELGGQMENIGGQGEVFRPAFLSVYPDSSVLQATTPLQAQKPPTFSFGEEGKISFQPEGSDWVFSAGIRIGRSSNIRHVDHQTDGTFYNYYKYGKPGPGASNHATEKFADTHAPHREDHAILDFSVGKDIGLGIFGKDSTSTFSAGVRFAQFTSKATFDIRARPDLNFKYAPFTAYHILIKLPYFHTYHATGQASRSFDGVGPSLSWSNSIPFVGNARDGEIALDWGVNASVLFGKQKARVQHQTSQHYATPFFDEGNDLQTGYPAVPHNRNSVRSVTVPNVGGSIGLSWRVEDFKVSMGYRADFFFGAMDTGIDAVKKSNATFNGPYASISVGLGD